MKDKKINLGIIGLGYIGKFHLRNCLNLKSAKVVAVADASKKALSYAKELGVKKLFTDFHELLEQPDIEAVIISLPTHLHADCAINAIESGKHILLEKPIANKLEEGEKIITAARKHNVKLMVGYPLRFSHKFIDIKRKMESGVLGDISAVHAVNIAAGPFMHRAESTIPLPIPEWWFNKDLTGGGALIDLGSHMINLTRWYFGSVKWIKAYLGYRFNFNFEDQAICIAQFDSGTMAVINVGWFSQKTKIGIELYGTVDHISGNHKSHGKVITAVELIFGRTPTFFKPYLNEVQYFIDCIKNDCQPSPDGVDAFEDLKVIHEAYKNQIFFESSNNATPRV
ncbi:MAG: Gfo/Idh/MocA family oxidoreductase [Nitrososphaeria archaeon]